MPEPSVKRWSHPLPPTDGALQSVFTAEGLSPSRWSNGPGDRYAAHSHAYHKVLYCASGSISFALGTGETIELGPGDRLDLPPGTLHSAVVGPGGVTCLEAARHEM